MEKRYTQIIEEYDELTTKLAQTTDPEVLRDLGKRQRELEEVADIASRLRQVEKEIADNEHLAKEGGELGALAKTEIERLKKESIELACQLKILTLPRDPMDEKDIIMEIRAGAGGDEAALFAAELFRMYQRFADSQKWKTSLISTNRTGIGGYKEVVFEVNGKRVYSKLKYESGVHRVQRVPETEKSGRVHTSTVTVAVLPKIEAIDIKIDPKDLRIEASTSSGAGGQSVNTTYSAIKITHLPTGITAQSQDERSQTQNREKALAVIRARVYEYEREKRETGLRDKRRSQIGTGDRSEKIRTYNFPQDRVTDHRINQNFGQVNLIMEGEIDPLIDTLTKADQEATLKTA